MTWDSALVLTSVSKRVSRRWGIWDMQNITSSKIEEGREGNTTFIAVISPSSDSLMLNFTFTKNIKHLPLNQPLKLVQSPYLSWPSSDKEIMLKKKQMVNWICIWKFNFQFTTKQQGWWSLVAVDNWRRSWTSLELCKLWFRLLFHSHSFSQNMDAC